MNPTFSKIKNECPASLVPIIESTLISVALHTKLKLKISRRTDDIDYILHCFQYLGYKAKVCQEGIGFDIIQIEKCQ